MTNGRLIYYDGGHLTKEGAVLLGKLLYEELTARQLVVKHGGSMPAQSVGPSS